MEKTCENCKHYDLDAREYPCDRCCNNYSKFPLIRMIMPFMWEEPEVKPKEPDSVNHPSHYCQEGSMECIDEMVAVFGVEAVMNFCLLNVWKYRKRAVFKNGEEDLKKSDWYMKKYIELKKYLELKGDV